MKKRWVLCVSVILNIVLIVSLFITVVHNVYESESYKNENEIYTLDVLYNQEMEKAVSNYEKSEINKKYGDLWYEKIQLYNDALNAHYYKDEEMKNKINLSQDNWLEYKNIQEDIYFDFLISVFTTGSIVPIIQSEKEYTLNRERAIFLYQQCDMLFLEVEKP